MPVKRDCSGQHVTSARSQRNLVQHTSGALVQFEGFLVRTRSETYDDEESKGVGGDGFIRS